MIDFTLDMSGLNELARELETLSRSQNNKALRDATRAGAEVIADEVRARAPVDKGRLKRNVVVATKKGRRQGEITSGVHIRGTNPETGVSDSKMKANSPNNAFYWKFVELGTSTSAPAPFLRPAFDSREGEAANAVIRRLNQAIDEAISR